jgi:hypothetical protein
LEAGDAMMEQNNGFAIFLIVVAMGMFFGVTNEKIKVIEDHMVMTDSTFAPAPDTLKVVFK